MQVAARAVAKMRAGTCPAPAAGKKKLVAKVCDSEKVGRAYHVHVNSAPHAFCTQLNPNNATAAFLLVPTRYL